MSSTTSYIPGIYTETFKGRGNTEEDALNDAELKYYVWRTDRKRKDKLTSEERSKSTVSSMINGVHWKCELTVTSELKPADKVKLSFM